MTTMFAIPATGQPVRLRASGSLQVRCVDPGPPDRAVRRLAVRRRQRRHPAQRVAQRRAHAGAVAHAPCGDGRVADRGDGYRHAPQHRRGVRRVHPDRGGGVRHRADPDGPPRESRPTMARAPTSRCRRPPSGPTVSPTGRRRTATPIRNAAAAAAQNRATGRRGPAARDRARAAGERLSPPRLCDRSCNPRPRSYHLRCLHLRSPRWRARVQVRAKSQPDPAPQRNAPGVEVPRGADDITQPGVQTPAPGAMRLPPPSPGQVRADAMPREEARGADPGRRNVGDRPQRGLVGVGRDRPQGRPGSTRARPGAERPDAIRDGAPAAAGLLRARGRSLRRDDLGPDRRRYPRALT